MKRVCLFWFSLAIIKSAIIAGTNDINLTVVAGAETHAMIEACDCPKDPGGGLSKRAFLLKKIGRGEHSLFLDAGGFSGGGIYDSYTEGRAADSLRTIGTLRGMGVIGYDAAAVGDDDLQYGGKWLKERAAEAGVPLVSANCFVNASETLVSPYLLIKKGQYTIGVTGLTPREKLFDIDKSVSIKDPVSSLRKYWKEMTERSDFQVILSHLGQENSIKLRDSFPECDLIVNGHRKADIDPVILKGGAPVMQFGFQGKSLSFVDLRISGKRVDVIRSGWLTAGPEVPDDSSIVEVTRLTQKKPEQVYDLYIMSQCPYGLEALVSFRGFVEAFPELEWNLWFIGTVESDSSLTSLHGEGEVRDEMLWLAVKELYPDKWVKFIELCSEELLNSSVAVADLGLDKDKIEKWINAKGRSELAYHYTRSKRLNINASPTLLINNSPYKGQISKLRLGKIECAQKSDGPAFCDSLPQCIDDSDCRQTGKIGRCVSGNCEFRDAVPFVFSVLVADPVLQHPESEMIATTRELFPGATIDVVTFDSKKGKELIKEFNPQALPFYVFGKEVKLTHNFSSVESGLLEKSGGLIFKDGIARRNYYHLRKQEKGSMVLFVDPFFPEISAVLNAVFDDSMPEIRLKPVFYSEPTGEKIVGTEERFRQEESKRWLLIDRMSKEKFRGYLKEYVENPGSSYWFSFCRKAGLDPDTIAAWALRDSFSLEEQWKLLRNLSIKEPLVLFLNNREIVTAGSLQELKSVLSSYTRRNRK